MATTTQFQAVRGGVNAAGTRESGADATGTRQPGMVRLAVVNQYQEAQEIVDRLSDAGFRVERTAIVAEGLRLYEQVTGRTSWLRSLSVGAGQGLFVGLVIAWLFSFLSLAAPAIGILNVLLWGAVMGVLLGAALGLVGYALSGGRRDFTSVSGFQADSYAVLVEVGHSDEARKILGLPTGRRTDFAEAEAH